MSDIYRRCGCRDENGKLYGPLPDRATDRQKAAACPKLVTDPKHGTWGFAVSAGVHAGTGKRVQVRRMGFATKKEAQQERSKIVTQVSAGQYRGDQKVTLGAFLPTWLERRVQDGLRPSTERMYRRYIKQDLVPAIGLVRLSQLRKHQVDQFIQQLRSDGRGATTIRRIHAVLSSALTAAERLDLIDFNPATKIALPTPARSKAKIWEPDQVRAFLDAAAAWRILSLIHI